MIDPDEPDEFKVPCQCKAPNCRKFMNQDTHDVAIVYPQGPDH